MSADLAAKPLSGHVAGISVSNGDREESARHGFDEDAVNRVVRNLSRHLLSQGARLVFGHDWRPDGVMTEVLNIARNYSFSPGGEDDLRKPMVTNCVAWPDEPYADPSELNRLKGKLQIERVELPAEVIRSVGTEFRETFAETSPQFLYARACTLTSMRVRLTQQCTARICLGGKISGSSGRFPGILEEALFALDQQQPLYLSSLMGGASAHVIAALRGTREMPAGFGIPRADIRQGFEEFQSQTENPLYHLLPAEQLWQRFAQLSVDGLSEVNGLTPTENERLFNAATTNEVIMLITHGLAHIESSHPQD